VALQTPDTQLVARANRPKIPITTQVEVLFRAGWLCSLCHRPTVFPLAMKYLADFVRDKGYPAPIAYYDFRWRRDAAPMLDHLACVIDHVDAYSRGGAHELDNFAVACNKCNVRKNNAQLAAYLDANPSASSSFPLPS
jgi:5-methylcytosine-specific restriction endonuclease McrA